MLRCVRLASERRKAAASRHSAELACGVWAALVAE
jgi:hypothetical protein